MLLCSVILVSIGAATLTSALTLSHMGFSTKSGDLSDLRNQSVAIIGGTDVEGYLQSLNVNTVVVDSLPDAIQSLKNDKVVAVIADKLLVNSYMKQNKISNIYITDMVVRSNIVAFALPKDSVYKDRVNESIVRLQNSNWIYHMCLKYLSHRDATFCNL